MILIGTIFMVAVLIASIFFWIGHEYARKAFSTTEVKNKFYNTNRN